MRLPCTIGAYIFYSAKIYLVACFARGLIGFGAAFATVSYMKIGSIWFSEGAFAIRG